jgi:hypothetical protein
MFKILIFQNKFIDNLLVFRCSEIPDTTYDIQYNYAKQSQFRKKPNERKFFYNKLL